MKKLFLLLTIFTLTVPMLGCGDKKADKPPAVDNKDSKDTKMPDSK